MPDKRPLKTNQQHAYIFSVRIVKMCGGGLPKNFISSVFPYLGYFGPVRF